MTTLEVRNVSRERTTVWITLGATPGCVQDVSRLVLSGGQTVTPVSPLQGSFDLAVGDHTLIAAPNGEGLNGNIAFGTPPLNCPTTEFPNGVNLAEFIINNGFQPGGQETVDVSCVAGANVRMRMMLGATDWTTNGGAVPVHVIENGPWDENTGRNGVFPYGCDECVASVSPPECVGRQPQFVNAEPICNVQRPAQDNRGGVVAVELLERFD